jgi:hypothetical protein
MYTISLAPPDQVPWPQRYVLAGGTDFRKTNRSATQSGQQGTRPPHRHDYHRLPLLLRLPRRITESIYDELREMSNFVRALTPTLKEHPSIKNMMSSAPARRWYMLP